MDMISNPTSQGSPADAIVARLRPRTVGEVIDQAFRLYRGHFLALLAIIAVGSVPIILFIEWSSTYMLNSEAYAGFLGILGITGLQSLLMTLPGAALVIAMLSALAGGGVSFKESYRQLRRALPRVLGLLAVQLLLWLIVYFPVVVVTLGTVSSSDGSFGSSDPATSIALLSGCLALPYLIVSIRLYLVLPALIAEDLGPLQALRRSWNLTRNYWWRTFALSLVVALLYTVILALPESLILGLLISIFQPDATVIATATSGLNIVFGTLFLPVEILSTALYYIDQRVRKEGFDLETAIARRYPPVASYDYATDGYAQPFEYNPGSYGAEAPRLTSRIYRVKAQSRG
ncbi:MAG: glycerophosphoryl diester phosphodiesterase membrane domain-containing protein [Chloroflexota bacterium]|nr:glycerophosphoryl diester phosphodiesterase membrane domain-containing protein [Chloroflexota bacterium]